MQHQSSHAHRVLLAIEDAELRRRHESGLKSAGFAVVAPTDADAVATLHESFAPEVLVVESTMEGPDDRPLYRHLRRSSDRYLICIDASSSDRGRIEILRSGADDAVPATVSADELAIRCQVLMRRPKALREDWTAHTTPVITLGPLVVDTGRHEIRLDDVEIAATRIEFSLLEHLARHPDEVCSRAELIESVWGPNWVGDTHVVDVHLSNLRRKLDQAAPELRVIHTVRGVGFRISNEIYELFEEQQAEAA